MRIDDHQSVHVGGALDEPPQQRAGCMMRVEENQLDPIIERIVSDPAEPMSARRLSGRLGKSNVQGSVRLYVSGDLTRYLELVEDDILAIEPSPRAGSVVWIRNGARARRVDSNVDPAAGSGLATSLLDGPLAEDIFGLLDVGDVGPASTAGKPGKYTSLITFTTIATTPSCAIIVAVTFSKSCVGCN